jgi:peptide/nickel transport system substrate-binding protein
LLTKLGFNVEVAAMDFGTLMRRRASKDPVDKGGWSIFHTSGGALTMGNPADSYTTRGPADGGWAGWYTSPEAERLTFEWLEASTPEARQTAFAAAQQLAYDDVPIVPLGFWRPKNALRKDIAGVTDTGISLFWNVRRT